MNRLVARCIGFSVLVLALLTSAGCGSSECKPCQGATCLSFADRYTGTIQIGGGGCGAQWSSGRVGVIITQTQENAGTTDEWARLTAIVGWIDQGGLQGMLMDGALCATSDTTPPAAYNFSTSARRVDGDIVETSTLAGVLIDGGNDAKDLCATLSIVSQQGKEICATSGSIFTSATLCD